VESLLFQIGNGGVQVRADGVCESPHRIAKKKKSFLSHGKLFYFLAMPCGEENIRDFHIS
jgi:hypothetical protein